MTVVWLDDGADAGAVTSSPFARGDLPESAVRAALGATGSVAERCIVPQREGQRSGAVVGVEACASPGAAATGPADAGSAPLTLHVARKGLERLLPEVLLEGDDGTLVGLLRLVQHLHEPLRAAGEGVADLVDPDRCPEALLPWLCSWLGERPESTNPDELRRFLRAGTARDAARGTLGSFRRALEDALGLHASLRLVRPSDMPGLGALRLGSGPLLPSSARPFAVEVSIAVSGEERARLTALRAAARQVAHRHLPAHLGLILRFKEHADGT